ncbi:putative Villin-2 [Cocos nucifera]|uniref:Putative Villin-2 n=1 Tax=Cocos nucifera TaxID=13894 RepID=A0A8K0I5V0_COCNU|nr:putative Villin-2 [Cocos nucifera]
MAARLLSRSKTLSVARLFHPSSSLIDTATPSSFSQCLRVLHSLASPPFLRPLHDSRSAVPVLDSAGALPRNALVDCRKIWVYEQIFHSHPIKLVHAGTQVFIDLIKIMFYEKLLQTTCNGKEGDCSKIWVYEQIFHSHPIKLVHAGTQVFIDLIKIMFYEKLLQTTCNGKEGDCSKIYGFFKEIFLDYVHQEVPDQQKDESIRGIEIWRIENFQPVPLPKSDYGKFYSGDSYIVLQTTAGKGGAYLSDIHFWLGKDTSQDEAGTAAIKTVELDAVLGGRAVQHRELQGHESDKFLSLFKPCIIPLEGGVASGFKKPEEETFETRLYTCRGKRVVRLKQVPFARSSLNHDDVFILDTENKIYQFNGANSSIQERAKALEVIQYLKDKYHEGKCDVAIIDDGKLQAESDSGEFWVLFGGFAPIGKKTVSEDDHTLESTPGKLYSINDGQWKLEESALSKAMLENDKCYLLDCGAEEFIMNQNRPKATRITQVIQGFETHSFKSNFESWPVGTGTATSVGEDGRGKGVDLKGMTKGSPVNEEVPPLLQGGGKIEVWRINGSAKTPIPSEEDDRMMANRLANTMCNSLKGRPVQGRIVQGKEPPQFIALFQPMVILKGGVSSGYKKLIADKKENDDTYTSDGIALIRVSGTSVHNNKAVQVDAVATSLSSTDCFLLQSGHSVFIWHGSSSTFEQQNWAAKVAEFLKPAATLKHAKEGTESSAFWFALGGKQSFTTKKVTEVYNFSQDDLLTEDILILDTYAEVFVWVGQSVDPKEKQNVFEIGQKYIELAAALEGLSPDVPLYRVTEGNEPCFFTTFFSWDGTKAVSSLRSNTPNHGGPTQRASALAALSSAFNPSSALLQSSARSNTPNHGGPTQRASALAALSSAFNPSSAPKSAAPKPSHPRQGSQRAAAVAALSNVLTAEQKVAQSEGTADQFRSRSPSPEQPVAGRVSIT